MTPILSVKHLDAGYDNKSVVSDIHFDALKGQMICLLGPNGAGKSTILRTLSGLLAPINGVVEINGVNIKKIKSKNLAKDLSLVLTDSVSLSLMTVYEIAAMGRIPHTGFLGNLSANDYKIVDNALETVGAANLKDRYFSELSDGEKQKVMIARALVQEPDLIILDEPTSHLDIKHKVEVIRVLQRLTREKGITCILALHDIDLAMKGCQTVILVHGNNIAAQGTPEEIIGSGCIQKLYDISGAVYNELLGSIEFVGNNTNEIFIIGGNGSGIPLYRTLSRMGYGLTAGVLHENDIDFSVANTICSKVITESAFEPIKDISLSKAKILLQEAKCVIDAGFSLGYINQKNMELLKMAQELGKPILSLRNNQNNSDFIDIDVQSIHFYESIGDLISSINEIIKPHCL